jgi:hypothetical protein
MKEAAVSGYDQPATMKRFREGKKIEEKIYSMNVNDVCRAHVTQHTWRNRIALRSPKGNSYHFDAVDCFIRRQAASAQSWLGAEHAIQRYHAYREATFDLPLRKLSNDVFESSDRWYELPNDVHNQHGLTGQV